MKEKILYYVQGVFDLAIAKSIKEKHDCQLYALIDVNRFIKKTFLNQKLVEFQKVWYFQDALTNLVQKPNLEYLSNFEKEHNINLWLIAFKERHFLQFNDYYKFNRDQILRILEKECRFFEDILKIKPDFLIIKNPDYHHNLLLYELCKSHGITVLTINHTRLGIRHLISEEPDRVSKQNELIKNFHNSEEKTFEDLQNFVQRYSKQVSVIPHEYHVSMKKQLHASLRYLFVVCNSEYRKYFVNFGRTRTRILTNESLLAFKRLYRESFLKNNLKHKIPEEEPFVYFSLHFQPERSTLVAVPFYQNQVEVISHVARSLPIEYKLYVKEHPAQKKYGWRPVSYYKSILNFPNVEFLHPSIPNSDVLKKSSLVISIAGTPSLEAAFYKKPSIVFSDVGFASLPSVYRVKSLEELPQAIRTSLKKEVKIEDLSKYVKYLMANSFEHDNIEFAVRMMRKFFYGGFLYDVEIPIEALTLIIQENKTMFDTLADEYIKKIKNKKNGVISSKT